MSSRFSESVDVAGEQEPLAQTQTHPQAQPDPICRRQRAAAPDSSVFPSSRASVGTEYGCIAHLPSLDRSTLRSRTLRPYVSGMVQTASIYSIRQRDLDKWSTSGSLLRDASQDSGYTGLGYTEAPAILLARALRKSRFGLSLSSLDTVGIRGVSILAKSN
ncbi:unnamed protein product [Parajaminaea phylloscopi]